MVMNIFEAPFVMEMRKITQDMYRHGWDERNGGNVTYLLKEEELAPYLDLTHVERHIPIDFEGTELAGQYFIVTGSGKYFKNVYDFPADTLGIIRVAKNGKSVDVLWGLENGGRPTSELPSHLMSHAARLSVDTENRVIMHCHASHLLAMTFTVPLEERSLTRLLWQMCTECLVVFPDGVSIIPWLVPGTNAIGEATSAKMKDSRLVVWPHHGIYGAGRDIDETYGLIETAEKAAQVYTYVQAQGGVKQTITDKQLADLGEAFGVIPKEGYLDLE